ncbi:MAG: carboxypeptidase-like regulatory domain-containing protein, partial [Planctomycetota bacterium]|nr:carboxypeptidase-like regulatory domain-containing protein [Planctomycetota bacterium]
LETNSVGEFETPQISTMKRVGIRITGPVPVDDGELVNQKVYDEWKRPQAEQTTRIDLDLNYQRVQIAVVDKETGAPVPGAEVKMRGKGRRSWRGGTEKTTDAKGLASFVVPDGDERTVQVTKEGYGTVRLEVSERDAGETLVAELQPAVPCRGTVVPPDGANRDRLFFRVDTGGGRGEGWTPVDPDELTFSVEGLMPGTYRAETWTGSQGMIQVEFNLGPNGDENLVLDFTRPIK